jgi:hypothetical protein
MNCAALESLIALYVEDDLSASDKRRIETHLQTCPVCSGLAEDLRESQSMFKSLRAGTVKSADLINVRERVLNEVGDLEPAPGWVLAMNRLLFAGLRRKNAIAGVVLATIVSGGLWYSHSRAVGERKFEPPVDLVRYEPPPSIDLPNVAGVSADSSRIAKHTTAPEIPAEVPGEIPVVPPIVESSPQEALQLPMKFVTDDPNIIIYWLPADKGD